MNLLRFPTGEGRAARAPENEMERERIKLWLQRVLAKGDAVGPYTVERLCRKAGTSPTNITRFLKDGSSVPRLATLARIADTAGVPAPGMTMTTETHPLVDVPVILPQVFLTRGIEAARMASFEAIRAPAKYSRCVAVKITADTGTLAGVLLGDMVIVDPVRELATNDLVVVALDTGLAGIYRVQGEWLVPQSLGSLPSLPLAESSVIGIARQVQRELR